MTNFASFADALAAAPGQKNLLVGNGLSIAFAESFRYAQLFDAADFSRRDPQVADVFNRLKTHDFETVAAALQVAAEISQSYGATDAAEHMEKSIVGLKDALIEAVNSTHPADRNCLSVEQCANFCDFVAPFLESSGKIFSLNYDALVYWALLRRVDPRFRFADGFSAGNLDQLKFEGDRCRLDVNLLFPHGALFIFERNGDAYKPRANRPLLEIITDQMEDGDFPLFVSEGSCEQKLEAIRKSFYLNYCLEMVDRQQENFFVYGHSLDLRSDGHILTKIASNKNVKRLFASFYNHEDEALGKLHLLRDAAEREANELELHVYPARSVSCW